MRELINLVRNMRDAKDKGKELGLNDDESAFYDALTDDKRVKDVLEDYQLSQISRKLADSIKKNTAVDWTIRERGLAKIRVVVKRLLRKDHFPQELQEETTRTVLEQAKRLYPNPDV